MGFDDFKIDIAGFNFFLSLHLCIAVLGDAKAGPVLRNGAERRGCDVKGSVFREICCSLHSVMANECDLPAHSNLLPTHPLSCLYPFTVAFGSVVYVFKLTK